MSGGQKIHDHSFWAGKGGKGSVFPLEAKMKDESSAEGDGSVDKYEDTTEAIKSAQMEGASKMRKHKQKDGYRH
ncbi:MAG: hypothetical protein KGI54_09495 [Pseudomonadota bacterium]|nr:hypothetical protein [Pseudomonadota bacterium]